MVFFSKNENVSPGFSTGNPLMCYLPIIKFKKSHLTLSVLEKTSPKIYTSFDNCILITEK